MTTCWTRFSWFKFLALVLQLRKVHVSLQSARIIAMDADEEDEAIKITACGDNHIGKTDLLIFYQSQELPRVHIPTIFENKTIEKEVKIDGQLQTVAIDLWDTAGQEEFDRLRLLAYPGTNVFLLCFCVVDRISFKNLAQKWLPEIKHHEPDGLIVLVGTKSHLRVEKPQEEQVAQEEIDAYKEKIGAVAYVETSALQRQNVDLVFETAIQHFLGSEMDDTVKSSRSCKECVEYCDPCALSENVHRIDSPINTHTI